MFRVVFLLLFTIFSVTQQQLVFTTPKYSLENTNAYLRSFLPWWPQDKAFQLRTFEPPVSEVFEYPEKNETKLPENLLPGNETTTKDDELKEQEEVQPLDPKDLEVHNIPLSPLDELNPAAAAAPRHLAESHEGNFIINFDEMGECPRDCSKDLQEALGLVLKEMSHVERYEKICGKYSDATACVSEDLRCNSEDRGMFQMMTSGLNYMCVEQELAFNATIKCIDDEAGLVQSECENQCQTKNLFMNWMMRTVMKDTIQNGVNGIVGAATGTNPNPLGVLQGGGEGWADMLGNIGKPPTPESAQEGFENFRQFTNDLCRVGDCMLDCIRSKFNTRCEGSAGTLLSEVLVRPIAASQNKLAILRPIMGMFMPEQCAYLHSNSDLKKHRIDSTMDEELKRMYTEKAAKEVRERIEQDELLSNLVPLDENGVPLPRALPDLEHVDSPLDNSVKTLDQLILDMYSKNETEALNISEKNNVTATFYDEETTTTTEKPEETTTTVVTATTAVTTTSEPKNSTETVEASGESSGESSGELIETSGFSSGEVETSTESSGDEESSGEGSSSGDVPDDSESSGDNYTL